MMYLFPKNPIISKILRNFPSPVNAMDFFMSFTLCLLFSLALIPAIRLFSGGSKRVSGKLPPGPTPLPVIGNLLSLNGDKPHQSLTNLAKIHGPLMTLRLGSVITVVVSSPSLAKQVLQKLDITFANRCIRDAVRALNHHEYSMVCLPPATQWRNLRKICNSYIFTTHKLDANQALRRNKVQQLLVHVQESCRAGEAVDISQAAFRTSLAALSNTIFSLDLSDWDSDDVKQFKEVVRGVMDEAGKPNLGDYFPLLRKFDVQGIKSRTSIHFQKTVDLYDRVISERMQLRKMESYVPVNDVLDILLTISEENREEMDATRIKHLFLDLFIAGADTTSSTLEWAMTELLRNPQTLAKTKVELEQKIGKESLEESDIARLPYLQAVIKETFRLHPAAPFLIPRKAEANVEISGFTVPEDAQVLVNAWAIGRDPNIWEDANSFVPERFLQSDIDVRGQNFELIPFGGGRRICPGLPLAMRMLHLMLGSLVHSFDWKLEDGVTPETIDMEEKFGLTLQKAQPLRAVPIQV